MNDRNINVQCFICLDYYIDLLIPLWLQSQPFSLGKKSIKLFSIASSFFFIFLSTGLGNEVLRSGRRQMMEVRWTLAVVAVRVGTHEDSMRRLFHGWRMRYSPGWSWHWPFRSVGSIRTIIFVLGRHEPFGRMMRTPTIGVLRQLWGGPNTLWRSWPRWGGAAVIGWKKGVFFAVTCQNMRQQGFCEISV